MFLRINKNLNTIILLYCDDYKVTCISMKIKRVTPVLSSQNQEERQKEISRRKMGQEMAKKKMQQEQDEIRAAARERRKDKEEDRLARERVK